MSILVEARPYGSSSWRPISGWPVLSAAVEAASAVRALGYETRFRVVGAAG